MFSSQMLESVVWLHVRALSLLCACTCHFCLFLLLHAHTVLSAVRAWCWPCLFSPNPIHIIPFTPKHSFPWMHKPAYRHVSFYQQWNSWLQRIVLSALVSYDDSSHHNWMSFRLFYNDLEQSSKFLSYTNISISGCVNTSTELIFTILIVLIFFLFQSIVLFFQNKSICTKETSLNMNQRHHLDS